METLKQMDTVEFYRDNNNDGEILAVFPKEKYYSEANIGYGRVTKEHYENTFVGYIHLGQHTPVHKDYLKDNCVLIYKEEAENLYQELKQIGYEI
jgi:hypothetical protein